MILNFVKKKSFVGIGEIKPIFSYVFFSCLLGKIIFLSFFKNLVRALTLNKSFSKLLNMDLLDFFDNKEK